MTKLPLNVTTLPLNDRITIVGNLATQARTHYGLWWLTASEEHRPRLKNEIDDHYDAWRFIQGGHFISLIVILDNIFGRRGDVISIRTLLDELIKKDKKYYALHNEKNKIEEEEFKKIYKSINFLRNKLFAHRDNKITHTTAFAEAGVTADQIKHLSDEAVRISSAIAEACDMPRLSWNDIPINCMEEIFENLRFYKKSLKMMRLLKCKPASRLLNNMIPTSSKP